MPAKIPDSETRTPQQLRQQWDVERELGDRLRAASKSDRRALYSEVYDELFQRVPHHPQLARKDDPSLVAAKVRAQLRMLSRFVDASSTFLEIGAGDCSLSLAMTNTAGHVYAVEVSESISRDLDVPDNFDLILSDGSSIPLADNSVDVAYSFQLMEHLHPDDAADQLGSILRVLKPGGRYVCVTPNRITGPWDISRYFSDEATGVHLKEFTNSELATFFRSVGFSKAEVFVGARGLNLLVPMPPIRLLERSLQLLGSNGRRALGTWYPIRMLLGVHMVGTK